MSRRRRRSRRRLITAGLVVLGTVAAIVGVAGNGLRSTDSSDAAAGPVAVAWQQAQEAGSYRFSGEVEQVTTPNLSVLNAGKTSRTETLYLDGGADLDAEAMELSVWSGGGSIVAGTESLAVRVVDGTTYQRQNGGEWREAASFTDSIAPAGDFLSYLGAARDVTEVGSETRAGLSFTRYAFEIDGPAYAEAAASTSSGTSKPPTASSRWSRSGSPSAVSARRRSTGSRKASVAARPVRSRRSRSPAGPGCRRRSAR